MKLKTTPIIDKQLQELVFACKNWNVRKEYLLNEASKLESEITDETTEVLLNDIYDRALKIYEELDSFEKKVKEKSSLLLNNLKSLNYDLTEKQIKDEIIKLI